MKTAAILALLLSGCANVSTATGTTPAERCAAYRAIYAGLVVEQANNPDIDRAARMATYKSLLKSRPR